MRTIRGEIAVHWRRREDAFELDLTIPGNVTAHATLPKLGLAQVRVTEREHRIWNSGTPDATVPGIGGIMEHAERVMLRVGSGSYRFRLTGRPTTDVEATRGRA